MSVGTFDYFSSSSPLCHIYSKTGSKQPSLKEIRAPSKYRLGILFRIVSIDEEEYEPVIKFDQQLILTHSFLDEELLLTLVFSPTIEDPEVLYHGVKMDETYVVVFYFFVCLRIEEKVNPYLPTCASEDVSLYFSFLLDRGCPQ